jgi:prepilin-type processing-associated H-X9-DG protein
MKYQSSGKRSGFTVLELMVVVFAVAILVLLILPALARPKRHYAGGSCMNNLKQVGLSFRMWSGDNRDRFPMEVSTNEGGTKEFVNSADPFRHFQALSNELNTPKVMVCRADDRVAATNFTSDFNNSRVSYFVGLNATEGSTNAVLSGDRKLEDKAGALSGIRELTNAQAINWKKTIHEDKGNILFADGSVRPLTTAELKKVLAGVGMATNRLAFPGGVN